MKTYMILAIAMLATSSVYAEVMITEIMYNPDGSDTDREWVEIYASAPTDMTDWSFTEGETKHGLTAYQGTMTVDGPAVIVDDGSSFLSDYPGYGGTILDSSFGLTNSGEEIGLADETDTMVDTVIYTPLANSGFSMELIDVSLDNALMENWMETQPTPGVVQISQDEIEPNEEEPVERPVNVPEFSLLGAGLITMAALGLVYLKRI